MTTLPSGTVTFLLTDVEGSTRLWTSDADAMAHATKRHYEIIDESVTGNGGVRPVEQGEGDSTVSAFARASDAVRAALDIQRAMQDEAWPAGAQIRVRIGIHTGEAQLRDDGNYFGEALNRCARVRSAGHGGQTLLSDATRQLVEDHLPDGATLHDLGEHSLRDVARLERIHQLSLEGMALEFPPLTSGRTQVNTLPVHLTSFIGREKEIAELSELTRANRLVTLIGSGGCGKTRLALEVAAGKIDSYADGVHWVDFSPLVDPLLVPSAVAGVLGVREMPGQNLTDTVAAQLHDRQMLIVFDNCEHLAAACASLADALLRSCNNLTLFATSREPLHTVGETAWHVPSLSLPSNVDVEESESVRLFADRASKTRSHFRVGEDNAVAVATICRRLDGIPLAIELAASRTRTLTPQQIADGLADRFRLLTGGARTALPRQRTLEASVEWSHTLLRESERMLFRRLSVFAGGFTLEAAERVCSGAGLEEIEVLDLLSQLVDRSLVQVEESSESGRYRLLETIRDYARHKMTQSAEATETRNRHVDFFLSFVERAEPELESGGLLVWAGKLEEEFDNIRAAMDWSVESGRTNEALRLPGALVVFWLAKSGFSEAGDRLDAALALENGDAEWRAKALSARTGVWAMSDQRYRALAVGEEAIALAREVGDLRMLARSLGWRGLAAANTLSPDVREQLEEARMAAESCGDLWFLSLTLASIGLVEIETGHIREARASLERSLTIARSIGDRFSTLRSLFWLGFAEAIWGNFDLSTRLHEEAIATARTMGDQYFLSLSMALLSWAAFHHGDYSAALNIVREGLEVARRAKNHVAIAALAIGLILAAFAEGTAGEAEEGGREAEEGGREAEEGGREAEEGGREAVAIWRAADVRFELAVTLVLLAGVAEIRGDQSAARTRATEALEIARDAGCPMPAGQALQALARLERGAGDLERSEDLDHEALKLLAGAGLTLDVIASLEAIAGLATMNESSEEATRLFGAAQAARDSIGYVRFPVRRAAYDADVALARDALGEDAFDAAWKEGAALTLDEAVAYATRARGERKRPSHGWASLTPTELEVVRLVREGLTNPQIGERLFISKGTVRTHLTHVFAKIGVATRSELAVEAERRGV